MALAMACSPIELMMKVEPVAKKKKKKSHQQQHHQPGRSVSTRPALQKEYKHTHSVRAIIMKLERKEQQKKREGKKKDISQRDISSKRFTADRGMTRRDIERRQNSNRPRSFAPNVWPAGKTIGEPILQT